MTELLSKIFILSIICCFILGIFGWIFIGLYELLHLIKDFDILNTCGYQIWYALFIIALGHIYSLLLTILLTKHEQIKLLKNKLIKFTGIFFTISYGWILFIYFNINNKCFNEINTDFNDLWFLIKIETGIILIPIGFITLIVFIVLTAIVREYFK